MSLHWTFEAGLIKGRGPMTPNGKVIVAEIAFTAWEVLAQLEKTPGLTILKAARMTEEEARAMAEKGLHDWTARGETVGDALSPSVSVAPVVEALSVAATVEPAIESLSAAESVEAVS